MLIERGGKNEERLYLYDDKFDFGKDHVIVKRTDLPDMENLIIRHRARYMLPAFFITQSAPPKWKDRKRVLDFPCGSGYGIGSLGLDTAYEGRDNDEPTLEYARKWGAGYGGEFIQDDLRDPHLRRNKYDLIACIEGIEHIERKYQSSLIRSFLNALKPGGILVISTPEKSENPITPYHLCELSEHEFKSLLTIPLVGFESVQILNHKEQGTNWLYGICRKGE